MTPALWYGSVGGWHVLAAWVDLAGESAWPARVQNQSLLALSARLAPDAALVLAASGAAVIAVALAWTGWRRRDVPIAQAGPEFALATMCAVVMSPIAWDHYWVLAFPAFVAVHAIGVRPRWPRVAFWTAAVFVTGVSPILVGTQGFGLARAWSASTVAALILIATLSLNLGTLYRPSSAQQRQHVGHVDRDE
jgi:hypothetical protein